MYNTEDTLVFIEEQLLLPTGTRLFPTEGKISLGILDKAPSEINVTNLDEDTVIGTPDYVTRSDQIVNQIRVFWDYHEGEGKFRESELYTDATSITLFGKKPEIQYFFKGVTEANSGSTLMDNLTNRILARLANPRTEITARCQMDVSREPPAHIVRLQHSELPAASSTTLNLNSMLIVTGKQV